MDSDDDPIGPELRALIERARARLAPSLLGQFDAGVRAISAEAVAQRERLARGEQEPIVVSPSMLDALARLGLDAAPAAPEPEPPANRRERRARASRRRRG